MSTTLPLSILYLAILEAALDDHQRVVDASVGFLHKLHRSSDGAGNDKADATEPDRRPNYDGMCKITTAQIEGGRRKETETRNRQKSREEKT